MALMVASDSAGSTGKKADPRGYYVQKTLQTISHSEETETNLMFTGHNACRSRTIRSMRTGSFRQSGGLWRGF